MICSERHSSEDKCLKPNIAVPKSSFEKSTGDGENQTLRSHSDSVSKSDVFDTCRLFYHIEFGKRVFLGAICLDRTWGARWFSAASVRVTSSVQNQTLSDTLDWIVDVPLFSGERFGSLIHVPTRDWLHCLCRMLSFGAVYRARVGQG